MTRTALAVALAIALGSMGSDALAAGVSGHCTYEGVKHPVVDGLAWVEPVDPEEDHDWDDDGVPDEAVGPDTKLSFASFKLDSAAIQRAEDRDSALQDQAFAQDDATKLQLTLAPDKLVTQQYVWISPGTSLSYSSNEVGKFEAKPGGKGRLVGHYAYTDDDAEGPHCDVTFDIAVIGTMAEAPPLPGKPLPADGGEPGKAYLAVNKAMLSGDLDAIRATLTPEQAAEMDKARATPEFAQQLALLQAMTARNVRIKGGRIDGDQAWVEFDAEEGEMLRSGTAEMVREDGRWRVVKESTRDRDK
jgi:hypothetical protein